MLAELGRRADAALERGTDAVTEAVHVTGLHVRRIAGVMSEAVGRLRREAHDLAWDYQDVVTEMRRPVSHDETPSDHSDRPALRLVAPDD